MDREKSWLAILKTRIGFSFLLLLLLSSLLFSFWIGPPDMDKRSERSTLKNGLSRIVDRLNSIEYVRRRKSIQYNFFSFWLKRLLSIYTTVTACLISRRANYPFDTFLIIDTNACALLNKEWLSLFVTWYTNNNFANISCIRTTQAILFGRIFLSPLPHAYIRCTTTRTY